MCFPLWSIIPANFFLQVMAPLGGLLILGEELLTYHSGTYTKSIPICSRTAAGSSATVGTASWCPCAPCYNCPPCIPTPQPQPCPAAAAAYTQLALLLLVGLTLPRCRIDNQRFLIGDHTGRLFITLILPTEDAVELHIDYIGVPASASNYLKPRDPTFWESDGLIEDGLAGCCRCACVGV